MTTFSPYTVGRVATRRSTGLPATLREMRPSWGMRRSAMLMSAMTLSRLITPPWMERGECMTSWSTPSTRKRIRRSCSVGSTWMSDARSATAWAMRRLTNLTMGASSTASRVTASSSSSASSSAAIWATSSTSASRRWKRSMASDSWVRVATTIVTSAPVTARRSSMARTLPGSAMATTSRSSAQVMGRARRRRAMASGRSATAPRSIGYSARSTNSRPSWRARAPMRTASVTAPSSTSSWPMGRPRSAWAFKAASSWAWVIRPSDSSISPSGWRKSRVGSGLAEGGKRNLPPRYRRAQARP